MGAEITRENSKKVTEKCVKQLFSPITKLTRKVKSATYITRKPAKLAKVPEK